MNELFDKFLNDELTDDEAFELATMLEDKEVGRELVHYIAETQGIVSVGRKIISHSQPLRTPKSKVICIISALAASLLIAFILLSKSSEDKIEEKQFLADAQLWITEGSKCFLLEEGKTRLMKVNEAIGKGDEILAENTVKLKLQDNSHLILAPDSRIRVDSIENDKDFHLIQGTVSFKIIPQKNYRYGCSTEDFKVYALGTEFTVRKMLSSSFVKVTESKVKVLKGASEFVLEENDEAVANSNELISSVQNKNYNYEKWKKWSQSFRQDPDILAYVSFNEKQDVLTQGFENPTLNGRLTSGRWLLKSAMKGKYIFPNSTNIKSSELTLFTWFKLQKRTDHPPLITKGDDSWRLQLDGAGQLIDMSDANMEEDSPAFGKTPIKLNTWYLACGVFTKNKMKLYLNGKLEDESISTNRNFNVFPFVIGGNFQKVRTFNGVIDEAAIIRRALTEKEILDIYLNGKK